MPLVRWEAVECGRNHDKRKPQAKCEIILDHEVLISEAELISKITFIFNSLGSFSDSLKKCFVCHIISGVVDTKKQIYTCGHQCLASSAEAALEQGCWLLKGLGRASERNLQEEFFGPECSRQWGWAIRTNGLSLKVAKEEAVLEPFWASHLTARPHKPTSSVPSQTRQVAAHLLFQCSTASKFGHCLWLDGAFGWAQAQAAKETWKMRTWHFQLL